jgi:flagellar protein FliL
MADDTKKTPPAAPEAKAAGGGGGKGMVTLILTVALAGGASFGGAKLGSAAHHPPSPAPAPTAHAAATPGPTIGLDPFLVTISEPAGTPHVVKLTIAVELKVGKKEDDFKPFIPRIRDATLAYLRSLSFEEAQSAARFEHLRADLLERIEKLGVTTAEQVLITDYVTQ